MEKLNKTALDKLLTTKSTIAATIYLPMHTTASPPHVSENQIRFKNLVHRAAEKLETSREGRGLAKALLRKLDQFQNDLHFWELQTPGLLICATPDSIQMFHLPIDTEEYVAVDKHFHLAPVLGLLHDAHDFYLLTLAQHNPKLYRGDLYSLQPTDVKLPANVKTALNLDEENQKSENQGTTAGPSTYGTASAASAGRGWFNGRGGAKNPYEKDRLIFFRMIDRIICSSSELAVPLIIAGVEEETVEYRSISKHPRLLKEIIPGNHSSNNLRSVFDTAKAIVWKELVMPEHRAVVDEYQRTSGTNPGRVVANDTEKISDAAAKGRVDKLLANMSDHTADSVRDRPVAVPRLTFPDAENSQHLNDVALSVWQASGTVYNLQAKEMPDGMLVAARLRY